jgi:hypothetical protein
MAYRRGKEAAGGGSMNAPREDGPDATHDQPAKTLTKPTTDFIARYDFRASNNPWVFMALLVVALNAGSLVLVLGVLK